MKKQLKKHYTLLISSNDQKDCVKEWHIPAIWVRLSAIGLLTLIVGIGVLGIDYGLLFFKKTHFEKNIHENQSLKNQIVQMKDKVKHIQSRLNQMEDFSYQLKILAGVENPTSPKLTTLNAIGPFVGPLSESSAGNPFLYSNKKPLKSHASPPYLPSLEADAVIMNIHQLDKKSQLVQQDIYRILQKLYTERDKIMSTPSLMPVRGWISSGFGWRQYPLSEEVSLHEGIDIAALPGTPVYAPGDGEVVFAGYQIGYGKVIIVDHGWELSTLYGHLSEIMVTHGQKIKRKQVIGVTGNTGHSSGPHLHYEVRIAGVPVDPSHYILNKL